ncbi:MAG TPA: HlyD family efflux transporter periplasmic adaptor subunit [Tepidisphaeraceae bacterium]|nr:HlyD family efflux transporter periplasmic adaptor subunit [Tepidisphaeraceae bacterium]
MSRFGTMTKWLGGLGVLGGVVAASIIYGPPLYAKWKGSGGGGLSAKTQAVKYYTAKKGELKIVVTEDGKLRAVKNHRIFPELRGSAKITFLATEGASVKKGDLLVSFDKKTYEDNLQTRKGDLEAAKRGLIVAEEALKIEQKTVIGAVKLAATKLDEAMNAQKVYVESEGPKKLSDLETAANEVRTKLATAAKTLAEAQAKINGELFIEEDKKKELEREVRVAKESHAALKKALDNAMNQRKTYRAYDYPQSLKSKAQGVENAKLDLAKAETQAKSSVLQKEAEVAKIKDQIMRMEREIKTLNEQIEKCDLFAPVDGLVLYGDPEQHSYYNERVKVGTEWYGGNTLMTIPDLSAFEVDISVPEEYRGKVQVGCKATLSVEAIPGLSIPGELVKLSDLARNRQQWDQSSPKVFDGVIKPGGHDKRMVSGMTTRVEIVAEILPDVLMVPIEAVINEDGETVCYVKRKDQGAEKRKVKPGKSNDHFVQILEGLNVGEEVDLSPTRSGDEGKAAQS